MSDEALRRDIQTALHRFAEPRMALPARALLGTLGYESTKFFRGDPHTGAAFIQNFQLTGLDKQRAMFDAWRSVEVIFQITDQDLLNTGQLSMFGTDQVDNTIIESYLFVAVDLAPRENGYTRSELAGITREVNRGMTMPVLMIFRHGETLTFSVIDRRLHKRDESRDVLEKVTLIKDIRIAAPHRAHLEILADLALPYLIQRDTVRNFVDLHRAWRRSLDSSELNKRFFRELANWYFWAVDNVEFPAGAQPDRDLRNATSVIRLITRLMFVWFLKEKGLVPDSLFERRELRTLLTSLADGESTFYQAILQNLFFATLNTEMNDPKIPRRFRAKNASGGRDGHYMIPNVYRYKQLFRDPDIALELFKDIPFLNGGLFECLDKLRDDNTAERVDGFSDDPNNPLKVPNLLFFGAEREVDLNTIYDTRNKRYKVRGLIDILSSYKFTIAENTPIEEEVALDPELLGQVFENLLANYNPETRTTARKQTGSFYTPREIVNYMVDESLIAYFEQHLTQAAPLIPGFDDEARATLNERLRDLLTYSDQPHRFSTEEARHLIVAVDTLKILDPAAGSGAFPMGILHKLVYILGKLDPRNQRWRAQQINRANDIQDAEARERAIETIEEAFERNELDYGRKLFLIENCIYGVDIQPVAVQIAKLRCFIALIVDQKIDDDRPNRGIRPLPNLETRFVAANTLISIPRPEKVNRFQHSFLDSAIGDKEKELARVRSAHFSARTSATKRKYRDLDKAIRAELATLLSQENFSGDTAKLLASWDPYDQNATATFFDAEWMFGVTDGFGVTIGNPPYVRADAMDQAFRRKIEATKQYETLWEKWDLYIPFIELGYKLLTRGGVTSMIVSDAFCHSKYAQKPQNWFLINSKILRLDFFSKIKIFDAAVHNITYIFQKAEGHDNEPQRRVHDPEFGAVQLLPTAPQNELTYRAFFPEDMQKQTFANPVVTLEDICYISVGMVVNADEKVAKGAFQLTDLLSSIKDSLHPKPFVEGKDLDKWVFSKHKYIEWGTARAPGMFRRKTFTELYEHNEKLMLPMVGEIRAALDTNRYYCNHGIFVCLPWHFLKNVRNPSLKKVARYRNETPSRPDLPKRENLEIASQKYAIKYLLGVLNSVTARQFLRINRRNNVQLYPDDWKQLPIPDVGTQQQAPIIKVVDQILAAKQRDPAADIAALEAEIDALVYKLYGLNEDEIAIVEESVRH